VLCKVKIYNYESSKRPYTEAKRSLYILLASSLPFRVFFSTNMSEKIDFKKQKIPFTQVANTVLNDTNISAKAKGIYAYLYSKPDGWDFNGDRIADDMKDGRKSVFSGLQELESAGYIKRSKRGDGRMVYEMALKPVAQKGQRVNRPVDQKGKEDSEPVAQNGKVPKGQSAERGNISNKDIKVIKSISNTSEIKDPAGKIIYAFTEIDPKNKTYYNNTTQRAAAGFLIDTYGFEMVERVVKLLGQTNRMPYLPTITTPVQLRDGWVKLENGLHKYKQIKQKKEVELI
jgi:hypothetical protein